MPRPTTKASLLEAAATGLTSVTSLIDELPEHRLTSEFLFESRDRNVRDVVGHLSAWHLLLLGWYDVGMAGGKPEMPAAGFSWKTTPALNQQIWQGLQAHSLDHELKAVQETHQRVLGLIEGHSEEELFTKKHYRWTGSTSLGSYLISATASHYDWALKLLRKASRTWAAAARDESH